MGDLFEGMDCDFSAVDHGKDLRRARSLAAQVRLLLMDSNEFGDWEEWRQHEEWVRQRALEEGAHSIVRVLRWMEGGLDRYHYLSMDARLERVTRKWLARKELAAIEAYR